MNEPTPVPGRCGTCKHWTESNGWAGWTDPVAATRRDGESIRTTTRGRPR
jgi:hypothetical protein